MRFWTAYQCPLYQAVKVEGGKVTKLIPDHPPQTPVRRVAAVGEYKGNLLLGRKAHIERYTMDGSQLISSIYHSWVWGLHVVGSCNGYILVASSGIDVCFLMDEAGNTVWAWWAWKDGYGPEPEMVKRPDWQTVQMTAPDQGTRAVSPHLNSANPDEGGIIVTLLRPSKVLFLDTSVSEPKSQEIRGISGNNLHDFKFDRRGGNTTLIGGVRNGVYIGGKVYPIHPDVGKNPAVYGHIKRVTPYEDDKYLVTYETGVAVMDRSGRVLSDITLPRPFNTVVF